MKCEGDFLLLHIYRALTFITKLEADSLVTKYMEIKGEFLPESSTEILIEYIKRSKESSYPNCLSLNSN